MHTETGIWRVASWLAQTRCVLLARLCELLSALLPADGPDWIAFGGSQSQGLLPLSMSARSESAVTLHCPVRVPELLKSPFCELRLVVLHILHPNIFAWMTVLE